MRNPLRRINKHTRAIARARRAPSTKATPVRSMKQKPSFTNRIPIHLADIIADRWVALVRRVFELNDRLISDTCSWVKAGFERASVAGLVVGFGVCAAARAEGGVRGTGVAEGCLAAG